MNRLLVRSRQAAISMRLGAGQASAKLTLFSRLSAASGATNREGFFLLGFHSYMVQRCSAKKMVNCDQYF